MPPWFAAHLSRTGSGEYLDQLHGAHARDHPADPRAPGVCTCGVDARAHHQCQGVRTRSHAPQAGAPEAPHLARQSKGTRLPAPASCLHARARAAPPPSPLPCHPCARHRQFAPALGDAIAYPEENRGFVVNTRTTRTVTDTSHVPVVTSLNFTALFAGPRPSNSRLSLPLALRRTHERPQHTPPRQRPGHRRRRTPAM